MKPSDLRRCLHVSNCESKVNSKLFLYVLVLRRTVYLNVLPDCFCSDASESSSDCRFSWNSPITVDTELTWLSDPTFCKSVHASVKLKHHKNMRGDLPNPGSDLGCQLGLRFFCKGGRARIQAEKSGQCALVSQSESPWCSLAHHVCTKVNELAVNFQLVGEKKWKQDYRVTKDILVVAWKKFQVFTYFTFLYGASNGYGEDTSFCRKLNVSF